MHYFFQNLVVVMPIQCTFLASDANLIVIHPMSVWTSAQDIWCGHKFYTCDRYTWFSNVTKLVSCSTQMSMKFQWLINT